MRSTINTTRLLAVMLMLGLAIACGSPSEQPAGQPGTSAPGATGGAPGTETAGSAPGAAGSAGAPAQQGAPMQAAPSPGMSGNVAVPAPPAPAFVEVTVPSGTDLVLTLETPVSSETAKAEQRVRARVAKPVVVNGRTAIPEGAPVTGTVVAVERSGRVKGRASLALRFNEVTVEKAEYRINTSRIARHAEATKGEDAKKIGIGAGAGAIIGGIAGGKKGVGIGAGVGGAAGTGVVLATRGEEVEIGAGATLRTEIQEPVVIKVAQ